jgi:hypothetical protein
MSYISYAKAQLSSGILDPSFTRWPILWDK